MAETVKTIETTDKHALTPEEGQDLQAMHTNTVIGLVLWLAGILIDKALKQCFNIYLRSDSYKSGVAFGDWMKPFCETLQERYEETQQIPRSFSLKQEVVDATFGICVPVVMQDTAKFIIGLATSHTTAYNNFKKNTKDLSKRQVLSRFVN